jgi:hypothetical protein
LQIVAQLEDTVLREDPTEVCKRINQRIASDDRSRADNRAAPDLRSVADDSPKFSEPGSDQSGFAPDAYFFAIQSNIRKDDSSSEMRLIPEHRIPHVIEMWYFRVIKNDAVFELARISKDNAIADDHVFPDITAASNLAVIPDPGWTFDRRSIFDQGTPADIDILTDEWTAHNATVDCRFEAKLKITSDLLERVPNMRAVIKDRAVFCLVKIQKIPGSKHKRGKGKSCSKD